MCVPLTCVGDGEDIAALSRHASAETVSRAAQEIPARGVLLPQWMLENQVRLLLRKEGVRWGRANNGEVCRVLGRYQRHSPSQPRRCHAIRRLHCNETEEKESPPTSHRHHRSRISMIVRRTFAARTKLRCNDAGWVSFQTGSRRDGLRAGATDRSVTGAYVRDRAESGRATVGGRRFARESTDRAPDSLCPCRRPRLPSTSICSCSLTARWAVTRQLAPWHRSLSSARLSLDSRQQRQLRHGVEGKMGFLRIGQ